MGSSSLTRDRTQAPCIGSANLSHWTTREVPFKFFSHLGCHIMLSRVPCAIQCMCYLFIPLSQLQIIREKNSYWHILDKVTILV